MSFDGTSTVGEQILAFPCSGRMAVQSRCPGSMYPPLDNLERSFATTAMPRVKERLQENEKRKEGWLVDGGIAERK